MPAFIRALFGRQRADDDHTQVRSMSSDYIDDELDEEQARRVKAHLDKCHLCAAFFNTLRATINLLGSAKPPGTPPSFRERLLDRLRGEGTGG